MMPLCIPLNRRRGVVRPAVPVDFLIDFESGSNGAAVDTTYLASVTRGQVLTWTNTVPAVSGATVATAAEKRIRKAVKAGSTKYTDAAGTRGLNLPHATNDVAWFTGTLPATHDTYSVGLWLKTDLPNPDFTNYDIFALYSGSGAYFVIQWRDGVLRAHTSAGAGVGASIAAARNTWYWCTMLWVRNDKGYLRIYNEAGSLVGTSESTLPDQPMSKVFIGCDGHGQTPSANTQYDDIVGVTGNKHPLLM